MRIPGTVPQHKPFANWLVDVTPTFNWSWAWQRYIQDHLDQVTRGELRRLMIFAPPQHGKSSLVTVRYPVYRLELDPKLRIIIGAYNQERSAEFSRSARRIARERLDISDERSADRDWQTTQGGGVRAVGVGVGITGYPGELIVIDDPVKSRDEADSQTYRDRVWEWYTQDLYTRLQPGGAVILIMTRWHEDDLAGRILASEDGPSWTVLSLPAEAEENDPLGREPGEALCPERYDLAALANRKMVLGSWAYTALYQQRPAPAEGGIIKREWLRYYDQLPTKLDRAIASWDMAFKDNADSSYVVGQVWGQVGGDFYLLWQIRERLDFPATQRAVRSLAQRYPQALTKLVEDKANGPAVIASLRHDVSGLTAYPVAGSKEARLQAVSPLFEAGNVYLPRGVGWIDEYVNELCTFPNAAHDDQVDATSQALDWLTRRNAPFLGAATHGERPVRQVETL